MRLSCPRCHALLALQSAERCFVGQCRDCGGLWLSASAADTVNAALDVLAFKSAKAAERTAVAELSADAKEAVVACPECAQPCARFTVAFFQVDHCPQHGTWYDAGELRHVRAELARSRPDVEAVPHDPLVMRPEETKAPVSKLKKFVTALTTYEPYPNRPAGHWTEDQGLIETDAERYERNHRSHHSAACDVADALLDFGDLF